MAYELIENKEKCEATIRMYGVIGRDVDGNRMAYDIAELDKDADTIHILINSDGGSVSQGLSVVSAILSAKAYIHAHVNGIAASMAAVIAVSSDRVSMQDYAKLMIHDPHIPGMKDEKLSARDRKALDSIADTLRIILTRRGCDKNTITSLMKDETWFSASEAQSAGLCDDVVTTLRKEELSNLSVPELMNRIQQMLLINSGSYTFLILVNNVRFLIQGIGFSTLAIFSGVSEMIARGIAGFVLVPMFGFLGACVANPLAWLFADLFLIPAYLYVMRRVEDFFAGKREQL